MVSWLIRQLAYQLYLIGPIDPWKLGSSALTVLIGCLKRMIVRHSIQAGVYAGMHLLFFPQILISLILMVVPIQVVQAKTFSDEDGEIIEFESFFGSDIWGKKEKRLSHMASFIYQKRHLQTIKCP